MGQLAVATVASRPPVRLTLFGGFMLRVGDVHVEPPASAQRLLAFLALGGSALRTAVAGALWPERRDGQALANLRTTVWRANRCVPEVISTSRTHVALGDEVRVDVDETVGAAAFALGAAACGSPDVDGRQAGNWIPVLGSRHRDTDLLPGWYDEWVIFERERLRHLRLHALEAVAARLTEQGQFALALDLALEALRCEPLRESAQRAVISTHLAEGNITEAIHAFERYRSLLHEQLGLSPSRQLIDLMRGVHHPRCPCRDAAVTPARKGGDDRCLRSVPLA